MPGSARAPAARRRPDMAERVGEDGLDCLRIVFVGQAVERKGLPLLLRAFEALREHIPTELTVIGPSPEELEPLMMDGRGVRRWARSTRPRSGASWPRPTCCAPRRWAERASGWC